MDGYRFAITCPQCGGDVGEVNRVRQSPVSNIAIVACRGPRCGKHFDLTVRLTPIAREGRTHR